MRSERRHADWESESEMTNDDMSNMWPEGTHRAEIRCIAAPRAALLSGDATSDQDKQFGNTQIVDARRIRDSREHDVIAAVEEHMVIDVMLAMWRDGYWPRKPIVVRWFVMKDVGLGAAGRLAWVERS